MTRPDTAQFYDPCGHCGGRVEFTGPARERVSTMRNPPRTVRRWLLHWRWQCLAVQAHHGEITEQAD